MSIVVDPIKLLLGQPIPIKEGVSIKIPTVKEIIEEPRFFQYSKIFTISTRELFSALRKVDELEQAYPTVWEMIFDSEDAGDEVLGQLIDGYSTGTNILIKSLAFWTGLEANGFQKLTTGKFIHKESNWIIDKEEFIDFSYAIATIIDHTTNEDFIAPHGMTDARYHAWHHLYLGRMKKAKDHGKSFADKILILSVSTETYIPINQIMEMSIYLFNKTYVALQEKEAYEKNWQVKVSPKFDSDKMKIVDWRDKLKIDTEKHKKLNKK